MPKTERGWTISTLQDHLEVENKITLFCRCNHSLVLSTSKLIEIFGPDFSIVDRRDEFLNRFRCNDCGSRPYTVHITSGNTPGFR